MVASKSRFSLGVFQAWSAGWSRRVGFVALVALFLSVGVPVGAIPADGGFPLSGLWSWRSQRPAWAAFVMPGLDRLPRQQNALGRGDDHYVPAGATRADSGVGRDAGGAPGALEAAWTTPGATGQPWTAPSRPGPDSFDVETSRRVAGQSNAGADTYQNADGSFTRTVSSGRINYQSADGSWKPIDTALVTRGDGRLHMGANSVAVSVAAGGSASAAGGDALASVTLPTGEVLAYGLAGAANVKAVVDGSSATYPGILPDTDLELVTLDDGLKETLVLRSPDAPNSWVFPLRLQGLTPAIERDGSVALRDAAGTVVAWIPAGLMWDSKFDPERGETASSSKITYELIMVAGAPALRVSADRAWLRDPARVFPVRVDPTTTTVTTGDAFVDNDPNTGAANQNGPDLTVGTFNDGVTKARSFIQFGNFDDDGLMGQRVTGARLKVYLSWTYDCLHRVGLSTTATYCQQHPDCIR